MKLSDTPITQHTFANNRFYLKRDDQLHSHFSGNKARKFMALLDSDLPGISTLISYGSAQSNALYSLAALARIKGWKFEFYVDHIPTWLQQRPIGNYRGALDLGAHIIEVSPINIMAPEQYIDTIRQPDTSCLVVPEGGRSKMAETGIKHLALEILNWIRMETKTQFVVALPSGTGTTAIYLQKYLKPHGIEVLTCACVGGNDYLIQQFDELEERQYPTIISTEKKHHFGRLYEADYRMWQNLLEQTHVEFDLLYDPMMWQCLLPWMEAHPEKTVIYIHQGGLLGNESMLPRYQRQFD
ncbi:1-aminocyclopropane-1-carboxylate deaminase/D-cysteine desulfhydrase [Vibrio anguillarum]|uniref:1-aminocyclopropane-1-carboxylate deaminase/D-cysteine desulfhydrase n=1 Tax=Vibrio anguillarum TaxID=55601 RepID=A0A289GBM7_VIBAN|nr:MULTISPECIES: pyridoxal-phosphate dependent enzyme [Vibrio]ASW81272.1 1-aminocyclopropane-1-carboxylate deaminase [Vibrio anguillarum]AXN03793.1 1-aminocyclopropane-1-carboxylate deaminase/D-cysteine desulfhydrase [Vibrio anguillarum]AZS23845.1 1-aminocyclopropane-1-carboxylate deaminase/D-cysteine desulfhydrase [Vibrio anguillarum]MBF4309739.1 1-aminocyclopropane-1-carboxylate deaminase/D-cysteine desulfhydrase [Vibrio anguillarum]MBF4325162.1 1-aminocyclopropane-1-carboxylate deaminase/D-